MRRSRIPLLGFSGVCMGDDGLTALKEFKLVVPTEENGFNVFEQELENESSVFFHMTEGVNKDAILSSGFGKPLVT